MPVQSAANQNAGTGREIVGEIGLGAPGSNGYGFRGFPGESRVNLRAEDGPTRLIFREMPRWIFRGPKKGDMSGDSWKEIIGEVGSPLFVMHRLT